MKDIINGLKLVYSQHIDNRYMIQKLALNEIKVASAGTSLGYFWTLFKDIVYFVAYTCFMFFVYGNIQIGGLPRMVFLSTALIPWYFISDCLGGGASSIRKRGGILTKIKFPMSIIPTYDVLSIFYKRLASYIIVIVILIFSKTSEGTSFFFEIEPLRLIYYIFAMTLFMMVFTLFISGFVAISKDFAEFYSSIVRIMFFFVPIIWSFDTLSGAPEFVILLLKLNPLVYLINGVRSSFVGFPGNSLSYTAYFWVITLVIFILGTYIQNKLKKVYADFL